MNVRSLILAVALTTAASVALAGGGVYPPATGTPSTVTRAEVIEQMRAQPPNFRGDDYPLPVEARRAPANEAGTKPAAAHRREAAAWPLNPPHAGA